MDFWVLVTLLGNSEAYLFLVPFVYFMISRKIGWRILLLTVLSAALVHVLKDFFKAPRPPRELWKVEAYGHSFPSGHATGASAFWFYLALKLRNNTIYLLSGVLILLISISRVLLGVHYIQDVAAGVVLGLTISFMFYYFDKKTERFGEKRKDEGLLIGALIILFASPYLIFKIPLIGAAFLGFGFAHVLVHFLNFEEIEDTKKRIVSFVISISVLSLVFVFENPLYVLITGFISSLLPQALWHFINKRMEKQR